MSSATPAPDTRGATGHALLTAAAAVVCLALAEWWGLGHGDLAVWTTFMVMAQYPFTSFQKGLERVVGRGLGILAGLALTTWFNDAALLALGLIAVLSMSLARAIPSAAPEPRRPFRPTVGWAIPWWVARQQSPPPFHPAG